MPTQVTNYQCPSCTGPLHFSGDSGRLECEYCGSGFAVAEIEALYAEKEAKAREAFARAEEQAAEQKESWDESGLNDDWGEDAAGMRAYSCPSCGAELICDETTAAASCPYCGNPTIVPGRFSGALKPDYVIPFRVDREAAVAALKQHYKGKIFLPKSFAGENHIQQIRGIYVPFWLFNGTVDADVEFAATRTHMFRRGDYEIIRTKHFRVRRAGTVTLERVPVDASRKMSDAHMDAIEPYDYGELKPFSTAYLPGFLADRYDVSVEECAARADERACNTAVETMAARVMGYDTCVPTRQDVQLHRGAVKYALLPVWMLNTRWKGQDFLFAMNGQTGRMVGNLPVSWGKFWACFGGIAAGLTAVITLLMQLL